MQPDHRQLRRARALVPFLAVLTALPGVPARAQTTAPAPATATTSGTIPATPLIKMQEVQVLGSRIRRTDVEGPSPVAAYDRDYILASGALTLADFMNYLPQNYAGIGAGRGSAPSEFNPEFGQRTETSTPFFSFVMGASDAPPGQTGVSGVSLRGLGSGSTLVLVDGRRAAQTGGGNRSSDSRQGFVDLNTIPMGMVERIEVITDGASALYGADAVGGVINIVLKKDWVGHELSGTYRGTFDGGARERQAVLTSGFAAGKLRGTVTLETYDRSALKASQREFSRNQDHRSIVAGRDASGNPVMGRDLRLLWGYPAVIQARTGDFTSITGPGGTPVRVVLVPEGATTTPTASQFIISQAVIPPASTPAASGQRRGNTSEFLDLVSPSQRWGATVNGTFTLSPRVDLYARYSYADTRGLFSTQPGVSSSAASSGFGNFATIVPAALNPFGQDVIVGMYHHEFGSSTQRTRTKSHSVVAGARGALFETWRWDAAVSYQFQDFSQVTRVFNGAAITGFLSTTDSSRRINPFIDARAAGNPHAASYEAMAIYNGLGSDSDLRTADFTMDGDLFKIWGGPVQAAWGLYGERAKNKSDAVSHNIAVNPIATRTFAAGERDSWAAFAELSVPIFGKPNAAPLFRRLDLQLAARHEDKDAFAKTVPKFGITWAPAAPLLLRASYSEGFRAPGLTEYQVANSTSNATVTDPRRTPASTTGVSVSRGSNAGVKPETSTTQFYGVVLEPPFAKGLTLRANYYRTEQKDAIQTMSAQTFVNNEATFADRVTRAAPAASDTALNQPGRITAVNITFINFGKVENHSIDYEAEYRIPAETLGRWRVNLSAARTLKAIRELAPGVPAINDEGDTFAPPKWKFNGSIFWNRGPWNASVFATYLSSFSTNRAGNSLTFTYPVPSQTKVDVRAGYQFKNGVWRGRGKGLRVGVGIGNVFDEEPPFSDTVFGFNGALHNALGRTYEFSFNLPF